MSVRSVYCCKSGALSSVVFSWSTYQELESLAVFEALSWRMHQKIKDNQVSRSFARMILVLFVRVCLEDRCRWEAHILQLVHAFSAERWQVIKRGKASKTVR